MLASADAGFIHPVLAELPSLQVMVLDLATNNAHAHYNALQVVWVHEGALHIDLN